jgi:hypothetical protein
MKYYKIEKDTFDILMKMMDNITMRDLDDWGISKSDGFLVYVLHEEWESGKLKAEE